MKKQEALDLITTFVIVHLGVRDSGELLDNLKHFKSVKKQCIFDDKFMVDVDLGTYDKFMDPLKRELRREVKYENIALDGFMNPKFNIKT